ncbi:DUF58 domain-containing protein [Thermogutta sp.]|jgi:uncharacterized protein (DUF58 family)|uniref:DUF58 domain-containing protein n=1 Tax=Thermogutta sp. TaxID=1962930 RepID=UPI003C7BD49B
MSTRAKITVSLTPVGRYYAFLVVGIFLAAMVRQVNLLLLLAGLIAAPLFLSWRMAGRNIRHLSVRRRVPAQICAGDLLVVDLQLAVSPPRGKVWMVSVLDSVQRDSSDPNADTKSVRVFFPYVDGTCPQTLAYRGRIGRRGCYTLGPLVLTTRFPLGLFEARRQVDLYDRISVCPRLGRLTENWRRRQHFTFEGGSRAERCADRVSGDFYGLRSWQAGDSPRLVHWRSSARHGELLVRQFDRPREQHLTVLLNLCCRANQPESQDVFKSEEDVEKAISFVATVIHDLCRKGGGSLLLGVSAEDVVWLGGPASPGFLERAMDVLTRAEPAEEDRLVTLFAEARQKSPQHADFLLVTTSPLQFRPGLSGDRRGQSVQRDALAARSGQASTLSRDFRLEVIDVTSGNLDNIFEYQTVARS